MHTCTRAIIQNAQPEPAWMPRIYGETISGVPVLRAFGASSKFLRDMMRCVDTVSHLASEISFSLTSLIARIQILTIGSGAVSRFVECFRVSKLLIDKRS